MVCPIESSDNIPAVRQIIESEEDRHVKFVELECIANAEVYNVIRWDSVWVCIVVRLCTGIRFEISPISVAKLPVCSDGKI